MKRIASFLLIFLLLISTAAVASDIGDLAAGQLLLPSSVQVIEESAFEGTTSVSSVTVAKGVKRIESRAFAQSSMKEITLPASLEYIADDAFDGCTDWKVFVPVYSYAHDWCVASNADYELYIDPSEPLTKLATPVITDVVMQDEYTAAFITWNPVPRAIGYRLYCAYPWDPENEEWIKTITEGNSALESELELGQTFVYRIQAFAYNEDEELILSEMSSPYSVYSGETVDMPVLEGIAQIGMTGLRLSWQAARNAATYDVYRSETGAADTFVKIATTADLTYEDTDLLSGTPYWYCVQGQSESGVLSPMSEIHSAETDAVKYRALLIGNTYPGASDALPGPDNDIAAMANMLKLQSATPYTVTSKLNVTTTEMAIAIRQAFAGADSTDVSVFYYSGHGSNNGNLCGTQNTRMSSQELRAHLDEIPGTKVVLLDCCYSGYHISKSADSTQTMEENFNESVISAFATKKRSYLAADEYIVLTACSMRQSSVSDVIFSGGKLFYYGVYTWALAQGSGFNMKTQKATTLAADEAGNADGKVTLGEAYHYVVETVEASPRYSQDAQYFGDLDFVLWGQNP